MKKTFVYIFIALCWLWPSCRTNRYIYAPSAPNIVYFTEKGDSKVSASAKVRDRASFSRQTGSDVQAAYAVSDHWAVSAAWFHRKEKDRNNVTYSDDTTNVIYLRNIVELGGGYFIALNYEKTLILNIFVSTGKGKFLLNEISENAGYTRYYNVNVFKWYLQPSLNFIPNDYFHSSFYLKPAFVHYGRYFTDYLPEELNYFGFSKIYGRTLSFPEMGFDIQLGTPEVPGVNLGFTFTTLIQSEDEYISMTKLRSRIVNFSIGLSFDFNKLLKR